MRDAVVALLRSEGRVRHLDDRVMASITAFFVERVNTDLARAARRHPLGFLVVSDPIDVGLVLRYHVWPTGWALPEGQESGQTHDHLYELNSLVVGGSLRQRTFQAMIDVCGGHEVLEVDYTASGSALRRTSLRARLVGETDEIFGVGTAYRLAPGTVHHVEAVGRPSATLVLSVSVPGRTTARVFVPREQSIPGEFIRDHLDAGELAAAREAIFGLRGFKNREGSIREPLARTSPDSA
jgi:hypothetical protein